MQHHTKARRTRERARGRKREHDAGAVDIVPDVLLPSQLATPPRSPTLPVQRLMLAVLEEAVGTYHRHLTPQSERARHELEDVQTWIDSEDASWPFSCESICHVLGLDVTRLRGELRRWREAPRQAASAGRGRAGLASSFRRVAGSRSRITLRRGARPDVGRRPSSQSR